MNETQCEPLKENLELARYRHINNHVLEVSVEIKAQTKGKGSRKRGGVIQPPGKGGASASSSRKKSWDIGG